MYVYWLTSIIEGPWDRVHQVIGQAHTILHQQGIVRIQTDIRVGSRCVFVFLVGLLACFCCFHGLMLWWGVWRLLLSTCLGGRWLHKLTLLAYRTDKEQSFEDKVNKVRELLKND
jgi:uncharacterized protein YqgV (UPF0045/DUF77 family)